MRKRALKLHAKDNCVVALNAIAIFHHDDAGYQSEEKA